MAREAFSEQGLPTPEVRQQILQRAGMILDEARDLMARLDVDEANLGRTKAEHLLLVEPAIDGHHIRPRSNLAVAIGSNSHDTTLAA